MLHKGKHPIPSDSFLYSFQYSFNDNTIIAKRYTFTTSNIKNSVFLAKKIQKRSEKDIVDILRYS